MLVEFAASGDSNPNSQFACSFDPPIYGNVIIPFRINESEVTGMEFSVDENVEPHSYFFDKVEWDLINKHDAWFKEKTLCLLKQSSIKSSLLPGLLETLQHLARVY